jgi:hypothetical protein
VRTDSISRFYLRYFYYLTPRWYALFVGEAVAVGGSAPPGRAPLSAYVTRCEPLLSGLRGGGAGTYMRECGKRPRLPASANALSRVFSLFALRCARVRACIYMCAAGRALETSCSCRAAQLFNDAAQKAA